LAGDFIGRQEVIDIQPLDVVAVAGRKRAVPGRRRPLVRLSYDGEASGGKPTSYRERAITGTVIDNDDFFPRPGLSHR